MVSDTPFIRSHASQTPVYAAPTTPTSNEDDDLAPLIPPHPQALPQLLLLIPLLAPPATPAATALTPLDSAALAMPPLQRLVDAAAALRVRAFGDEGQEVRGAVVGVVGDKLLLLLLLLLLLRGRSRRLGFRVLDRFDLLAGRARRRVGGMAVVVVAFVVAVGRVVVAAAAVRVVGAVGAVAVSRRARR